MKFYFAAWLAEWEMGKSLTAMDQPNRLLSFYWIKEHGATDQEVDIYVHTGICKLGDLKKKSKNKAK